MSDDALNAPTPQPQTGAPSAGSGVPDPGGPPVIPNLAARPRAPRSRVRDRTLRKPTANELNFTPQQRLLVLDAWRRSGLKDGENSYPLGVLNSARVFPVVASQLRRAIP